MEFGKDDFLEEFGDVREEGNSTIVGWVSLVFFWVFRYWCNVTKLEDCRDMASGDYGIEEISEEVACQRARVNDVLRVNSIWARGLVRFKALNSFLDFIRCNGYFIPCCSIKGQALFIDEFLEMRIESAMGRGDTELLKVGGPSLEEGISLEGGAVN